MNSVDISATRQALSIVETKCVPTILEPSSRDTRIRPSRSMRIVVTATSCRERGSGKHHRGGTNAHRAPRHATGNVSNFLWLLCIPMDGGRRSEMRAPLRGVRKLTYSPPIRSPREGENEGEISHDGTRRRRDLAVLPVLSAPSSPVVAYVANETQKQFSHVLR